MRNVTGEHDVSLKVVHGKGSASHDQTRAEPRPADSEIL
jgi:hypothetical protein